jgi:4-aminobutyrate aminotransferase-like enzyme
MGQAYRLFYDQPLDLVRGEGCWLFDSQGHAFLDAYNNVPIVGHCHPKVVAAVSKQLGTLNTHTRYLSEPAAEPRPLSSHCALHALTLRPAG